MSRELPTPYFQNSPSREPRSACPILRGSSKRATRSLWTFRMRWAGGASSLLSWRSASADSSPFKAIALHHVFQGDGLFLATADALETALGEIQILQIGKVLEDGFPDIVSLGAPSAAGQLF